MDEVIGIQAVRAALRDTPSLARNLYVIKGRRDARFNALIGMAPADHACIRGDA